MAHKESLASSGVKLARSKSTKGSPSSLDSSDSRALKIKSVTKAAQSASKQNVRSSDLQHQLSKLHEELEKEKEEKARAMQELTDIKRNVSQKITSESESKVEVLEKEVQKAKESERKMLESLVSQTKLLEQIKISLEEAKLENRSLRERNKSFERVKNFGNRSLRHFEKHLFGSDVLHSGTEEADVRTLRNELRLSTEAEEKSKVAMDGLASALKEVSAEANQVKEKFKATESELERVRANSESLKTSLRSMEEKFQAASEESERLKCELDESIAAWNVKENSLINCIKMFEEEINELKAKNDKLFESQRTAREENANLRDILKQAINEASVVKESQEITRKENSQLKDQLSEKENKLQVLKQEYECLKVSEAAATDSVTGLKSLLAATSTMDSMIVAPSNFGGIDSNVIERGAKFSSERWSGHNKRFQNGRRHSIGEPGKLKGSAYGVAGSPEPKHQLTASLSNMSEIRSASSIIPNYNRSLYPGDFDHIITSHMDGSDHAAATKKKKTFFRRFGDMLRRKNSYRQNSSFVVVQ
ncbi:centrosomal protein of 128 kDa-like [Zingiber officinale]|uniref:centrosomal protein of 128 kDa-like n=1 Tax=Zingiber officinale TaxID=94328 RepID=UPI001C4CDCD5|nr:centrosomal protein of 128 kDa-like [Zingiber officinale]